MPFLRLILIYIVVIAIAFAIINRDKVMQLAGYSQEPTATSQTENTAEPAKIVAILVAEETMPEKTAEAEIEVSEPVVAVKPATPSAEEQAIPATANPDAELTKSLDRVREAFWSGDAEKAEKLYVDLAAKYETDANIQGEAGNFFYSQRRFPEAAQYFHRAGLLLLKSGNKQQVMSIINALQGIAPDKATDLRARAAKQP